MSNSDDANNDVAVMQSAWERANAEFVQDLTSEEQLIYRDASIDTIMGDMKIANGILEKSKYEA